MNSVTYSFSVNEQMAKRAVNECGLYSISRKRQIIITVICLGVIVNSIYSFIGMRGVDLPSVFCLIASIFLIAYVDLSPYWYIKKQIDSWNEKKITVSVSKEEINYSINGEESFVSSNNYKGFRRTRNFFIIYFGQDYIFLPTKEKSDDELILTKEFLETYQTYGKGTKQYEDNFIKTNEELNEREEDK